MRMSMVAVAVMTLAQVSLAQRAAVDVSHVAERVGSVWDFVLKGGPVMIPLGLCSFVALTIVIERLVCLRRKQVIPPTFSSEFQAHLEEGGGDYTQALSYCEADGSPIATVMAAGLKRMGQPIEVIEKHIVQAGEGVVFKLRKNLRALAVIASIAPLLGLLGTIFGMIAAFQTVAVSGDALGRTEVLAKGIYQAMITTAAGLMLAIPVLIVYHFFSAKIEHLVHELDVMTVEFVETYAVRAQVKSGPTPKLQTVDDVSSEVVPAPVAVSA